MPSISVYGDNTNEYMINMLNIRSLFSNVINFYFLLIFRFSWLSLPGNTPDTYNLMCLPTSVSGLKVCVLLNVTFTIIGIFILLTGCSAILALSFSRETISWAITGLRVSAVICVIGVFVVFISSLTLYKLRRRVVLTRSPISIEATPRPKLLGPHDVAHIRRAYSTSITPTKKTRYAFFGLIGGASSDRVLNRVDESESSNLIKTGSDQNTECQTKYLKVNRKTRSKSDRSAPSFILLPYSLDDSTELDYRHHQSIAIPSSQSRRFRSQPVLFNLRKTGGQNANNFNETIEFENEVFSPTVYPVSSSPMLTDETKLSNSNFQIDLNSSTQHKDSTTLSDHSVICASPPCNDGYKSRRNTDDLLQDTSFPSGSKQTPRVAVLPVNPVTRYHSFKRTNRQSVKQSTKIDNSKKNKFPYNSIVFLRKRIKSINRNDDFDQEMADLENNNLYDSNESAVFETTNPSQSLVALGGQHQPLTSFDFDENAFPDDEGQKSLTSILRPTSPPGYHLEPNPSVFSLPACPPTLWHVDSPVWIMGLPVGETSMLSGDEGGRCRKDHRIRSSSKPGLLLLPGDNKEGEQETSNSSLVDLVKWASGSTSSIYAFHVRPPARLQPKRHLTGDAYNRNKATRARSLGRILFSESRKPN